MSTIFANVDARLELIEMAVGLKVAIVGGRRARGGSRVLLNYGHTLAHALEKLALRRGPDELRHGEAVAIGLAFAARLARALDRVGDDEVTHHDEVLARAWTSTADCRAATTRTNSSRP